jgi:hypothetical protein
VVVKAVQEVLKPYLVMQRGAAQNGGEDFEKFVANVVDYCATRDASLRAA